MEIPFEHENVQITSSIFWYSTLSIRPYSEWNRIKASTAYSSQCLTLQVLVIST